MPTCVDYFEQTELHDRKDKDCKTIQCKESEIEALIAQITVLDMNLNQAMVKDAKESSEFKHEIGKLKNASVTTRVAEYSD